LSADFSASYLAGGALSGAPYSYFWTREPADFNPGGFWEYWRFGPELVDGRTYLDEGQGILDPGGKAEIRMNTPKDGVVGSPYRYRLEVTARDAGTARGGPPDVGGGASRVLLYRRPFGREREEGRFDGN